MAEQNQNQQHPTSELSNHVENSPSNMSQATGYHEETAAEFAAPRLFNRPDERNREQSTRGRGIGIAALVISILSLFMAPVFFGIVGIVLGFMARKRGHQSLGSWAIGIGALSIIIGIFILPVI